MSGGQTNNTKQAAWVAIGGLFSFGFSIVSSMILSRYFSKADYGTYKQVIYVYGAMLTIFTLGLPKAYSYFLPRVERDQAKSLINKLTILFFLLGFVFTLVLFFGSGIISEIMNNSDLKGALQLFSVVPILTLPTMGLEGILATYRKIHFLTLYTVVTRTFSLLCTAIPVLLFGFGYMEAILGFVIAAAINCVIALALKYYPIRDAAKDPCPITLREIFSFSLPLLYASLWGMLISHCDQFFISRYYGNVTFAEFSNGSMELPFVGMILSACSTVLSPVFSRMSHEKVDPQKVVYPLWMSVFQKTAKLTCPLIIYCWFFADIIMIFLYGGKYEASYIYFRIKLITYLFTLIIYGPLLINIGKVKFYSNVHMYSAIAVILLEYVSVITINSPYAISIVSMLCQFGKVFVLMWGVSSYFALPIYKLFPIGLLAKILIPSALFLYIEHELIGRYLQIGNSFYTVIISFSIFVVFYFLYSYIARIDYYTIIKPLMKK